MLLRKLLDLASNQQVNALIDCFEYVFMKVNDNMRAKRLAKHVSTLQCLRSRKLNLQEKKKILAKTRRDQGGGFIGALAAELPTLLPAVIKGAEKGIKFLIDANTISAPDLFAKIKYYKKKFDGR